MKYFNYDSAAESLQGMLMTVKDNVFYYLGYTNRTITSFGPIFFVSAGSDSISDTTTSGNSDENSGGSSMEC